VGRGESGGRENSEEVWKDDCVSRKARKRVFSQSSVKKLKFMDLCRFLRFLIFEKSGISLIQTF